MRRADQEWSAAPWIQFHEARLVLKKTVTAIDTVTHISLIP